MNKSTNPPRPALKIAGEVYTDTQFAAALAQLGDAFDKAEFDAALRRSCGRALSPRTGGRVLQALQRRGEVTFDRSSQLWRKVTLSHAPPAAYPAELVKTLPLLEAAPKSPGAPSDDEPKWRTVVTNLMQFVACISLICALITLNASFAWELGREAEQFRVAFVVGLMALDLMRPFLVAKGFALFACGRKVTATVGLTVALALSPVSILSSTAILSSSFLLGAEMNADEALQTATLESLRGEHTRRLAEAEQLQDGWRVECARGGCGPLAAEIEAKFLVAQAAAQTILNRIVTLTEASNGTSDLLARMVITFERLRIFGQGREILLPLFLALSLELGALFGPALLLKRRP